MGRLLKAMIFMLVVFAFIAPFAAQAVELGEGMTQGQFALWLVKAIGAQSKLSPAATEDDAINFLLGLGVYPEGNWDKDAKISNEFLASLIGEEPGSSTFQELANKVKDYVRNLFDKSHQGVFRAFASSGSGSVIAG